MIDFSKLSRQPRDYQHRMLVKTDDFIQSDQRSMLIASPPGSGKGDTICMVIANARAAGLRCLFLVHKRELMKDIRTRLVRHYGISITDTGELYRNRWQQSKPVVFTTQQTAYRRLDKVDFSRFDLVFIDEAHRTGSRTYQTILDSFGEQTKLIGLTGTPWREDNVMLENFFQTTEWMTDMDTLLRRGFITHTKPYAPVDVDLSGVRSRRGDFVQADLDRAFLPYDNIVLEQYQKLGEGRKAIVFCNSVEQARRLQPLFENAGIPSGVIYHGMKNRSAVLDQFERNRTRVLFNIQIFTEGYDDPQTSCVIWATATQSKLKYVQATMRGIRAYNGKKDCIVIDLGSNTHRHGCVEDYTESVAPATKNCPECNFVMKSHANRCPSCGLEFMVREQDEESAGSAPREGLEQDDPGELALVDRMSEEEKIIHRYTLQGRKWTYNEDLVVVAVHFNWPAHEVFRKIAESGRGSERLRALFVDGTNKTKWIAYYLRAIKRLSARGLEYEVDYRDGQYYFKKVEG